MTSNPEQPNNIPTAGDNPNNAGHLGNIPYDNEPLDRHYKKDYELDTGQLDEIAQTGEFPPLPEGREPAKELPLERPTTQPETAKRKKGLLITLGVGAVGVATAFGAWFGATGGGTINLQPTKPTAEAPANPGVVPPVTVETSAPTPVETNPSAVQPEIVPKDQQIFHDANGNEQTYEERVEANTLSTKEFPTGEDGFVGFFKRAEQMAEYYPTEKEVRENLSLPADQPLTRENYILAAELHNKTFDPIFDQPGSLTGNSIYSVVNQVARKTVGMRYDRLNDSDTTNDNAPFDATYTMADSTLYFTYSDNTFDTEPTEYRMSYTRDISRTNSTTPAWQIPSNTRVSLAPVK